jgi:hypothetical protein
MRKPKNAKPNWVIYKITNVINGKIYVGKDKYNNPKYFGSGLVLKQAIKLYGIENFKKELIEFCKSEEEYNQREIYWIKQLNSFCPNGYNINTGGKGGDNFTNNPNKEKLAKIFSEMNKGRKASTETKLKMSLMRNGVPQSPCGKIKCPHCDYEGDIRNMMRWHFNNCKSIKGIKEKRCPHCKVKTGKANHIIHYDNCIKNPNVDLEKYFEIKNNYMKYVCKERNYIPTEEHKKQNSLKLKGRKVSKKTKKLQKKSFKKRWKKIKEQNIIYKCPHCDLETISLGNYNRWHNDNCKKNKS